MYNLFVSILNLTLSEYMPSNVHITISHAFHPNSECVKKTLGGLAT